METTARRKLIKPLPKVNASQIIAGLQSIHRDDLFIDECKNGPSQSQSHVRLDALAMKRSWASPCFTGYEVKVSRSDFKRDEKWHAYLPLCHQLYFVCPKDMITADEIPGQVGLKWFLKGRVYTVKKADYRPLDVPQDMLIYILMCRARIGPEQISNGLPNPDWMLAKKAQDQEKFKKWLEEKRESRRLGHILATEIAWHIDQVQTQNSALQAENEKLAMIRDFATEIGIRTWMDEKRIKEKVADYKNAVPEGLRESVLQAKRQLDNLIATLQIQC